MNSFSCCPGTWPSLGTRNGRSIRTLEERTESSFIFWYISSMNGSSLTDLGPTFLSSRFLDARPRSAMNPMFKMVTPNSSASSTTPSNAPRLLWVSVKPMFVSTPRSTSRRIVASERIKLPLRPRNSFSLSSSAPTMTIRNYGLPTKRASKSTRKSSEIRQIAVSSSIDIRRVFTRPGRGYFTRTINALLTMVNISLNGMLKLAGFPDIQFSS